MKKEIYSSPSSILMNTIVLLLAGCFICFSASAQTTYTWVTPGTGGDWQVAANWSPNTGFPSTNDSAIINPTAAFTITNVPTIAVGSIAIGGAAPGDTVTLASGSAANLTVLYDVTVTGGGIITGANLTLTFAGEGSSYNHKRDGGAIPIASWSGGSNCNVTGVTGTVPGNMSQHFYNFLWDNPGQVAVGWFGPTNFPTGIDGTFEMRRCGSMQCNWDPPTPLTWSGDIVISANRNLICTNVTTTASTFTIRDLYITTAYGAASKLLGSNEGNTNNFLNFNFRNITINGGALDFNGIYANNTNMNCSGNMTLINGNIYNSNSGYTAGYSFFNFNGTAEQDINITGTSLISGNNSDNGGGGSTEFRTLAINAEAGSIINFVTPFACGSASVLVNFNTIAGCTLMIPDSSGIVATPGTTKGSVRVPLTGMANFSNAANYSYTGTVSQVTGAGLPPSVNNLTFINPVGVTSGAEMVTGNLVLTNSIVTLAGNVSVTGTTNMNASLLTLGNYNLILKGAFSGSFSTANKVITNGTGTLTEMLPVAATVTFPVADNSLVYTPCSVTYTGGTFSASTSISCRVINAVESHLTAPDKLNRYWTLSDNIAGGVGNATFNYLASDVIGNESDIVGVRYSGAVSEEYGLVDSTNHQVVVTGFTDFTAADYTGESAVSGIHDLSESGSLSIYPNPVSTECNISFAPGIQENKYDIQIFDIAGALVQSVSNVSVSGSKIAVIKIADNVTSGVYLIRLTANDGAYTQKMIVSKD